MAFLRSRANLAGSSAALLVLLAHLLDLIGPGWGLLAIGAYIGAGLPFLFGQPAARLGHQISTAEALQHLRTELLPQLSGEPHKVLGDIIQTVDHLMPRLKEMEAQGLVEAPSRALLKQTITQLLPDCANAYLRLPPAYANSAALQDGKTAQDLLLEQLHLLQAHVHELEANLLSSDVNRLLVNGRFLQDRLRGQRSPLE